MNNKYVYGIKGVTKTIARQIREMHKKNYTRYQMFKKTGISSISLDKYLNRYITNKNLKVLKYKNCFNCGKPYPNTNDYFHYHYKKTGQLKNICKICRNNNSRKPKDKIKSRKIYNDDTLKLKTRIKRKVKRIIVGNLYWEKVKSDPIKLEEVRVARRKSQKKWRENQIKKRIQEKRFAI